MTEKITLREELIFVLNHASELEHSLCCSYLFTAMTLKDKADEGLTPETLIPLAGYVDENHEAEALLADAREASSAERNRITALPYKLVLPLLARRIAYAALRVDGADYTLAASCERQSLQQFFGEGV